MHFTLWSDDFLCCPSIFKHFIVLYVFTFGILAINTWKYERFCKDKEGHIYYYMESSCTHACVACSLTIKWIDKVMRGKGDNFQYATINHDEKWFLCNIIPKWSSCAMKNKICYSDWIILCIYHQSQIFLYWWVSPTLLPSTLTLLPSRLVRIPSNSGSERVGRC